MSSIRITNFGGIKPRDVRGTGNATRASNAVDCDLSWGSLRPFRYPEKLYSTSLDKVCSMFIFDCFLIASDKPCVDYTYGEKSCKRIFSTGQADWPAYANLPEGKDGCLTVLDNLTWKRLGVPKPEVEPEIVSFDPPKEMVEHPEIDYGTQLAREDRAYVYTYVNEWGEEGQPSDPSDIIKMDTNGNVTLKLTIAALPTGYEATNIRIYRLQTGMYDNNGEADTDYYFVDEIPFTVGTITYTDDVTGAHLDDTLQTEHYMVPRTNLKGISTLEQGVMVAFEGRNIWFTEPWNFHAWTCAISLDDTIKAIKVQENTIYVATDGYPYVISGQVTDKVATCARQVDKIQVPAPIVSYKSMVMTNSGPIWATDMGLVRMSGQQIQLTTHSDMNEDDWQEFFPKHMQGEWFKGQYFGFNGKFGVLYDVTDGVFYDGYLGENGRLTKLSLTPHCVYAHKNNVLYMSFGSDIFEWNTSDTYLPFTWKSKLHIEGGLQNYSTMKIVFKKFLRTKVTGNPVTMRLYADDDLIFERQVNSSRPFKLPKGYDALNWYIEVTGTEEIMEIHMATSSGELTQINNV